MAGEDAVDAFEAVFAGVAADAQVDDTIAVALSVKQELELVGVGLAGVGAVAGGERVAEAEEQGAGVGDGFGGDGGRFELGAGGLRRSNIGAVLLDGGRCRRLFATRDEKAGEDNGYDS